MYFATECSPTNPATRSQSALAQAAHCRQAFAAKLNEYKVGLLEDLSNEPEAFLHFVRLAVNEAESLACATPYAHLFLPVLAEEKIRSARQWASRQCRIGSGLIAISTATGHELIRWDELVGIQPPDTLATGRVSRSSAATSRAFEAARIDTCP